MAFAFQKYTPSFYTNIYLNAAVELGATFTILNEEFPLARIEKDCKQIMMLRNILGVNELIPYKIAQNKFLSSVALHEHIAIAPKYHIFDTRTASKLEASLAEILKLARAKDFAIVIKALNLHSGKGVYILPENDAEITRIVRELHDVYAQKHILVEDYFTAQQEYRMIIYKGRILDCIQRLSARVQGDGKHTIQELVAIKNSTRKQIGFAPIALSNDTQHLLEKQKLELTSVPENEQTIIINSKCNLARGGETKRIAPEQIHPDYAKIAKDIYQHTNLALNGLDLMTNDISQQPTTTNAYINEINASPSPDVQYFADLQEGRELHGAKLIISAILETVE